MEGFKKVGNTSFRVEAIKKMNLKDFKATYAKILKGQDLDAIYKEVTAAPAEATKDSKEGAEK